MDAELPGTGERGRRSPRLVLAVGCALALAWVLGRGLSLPEIGARAAVVFGPSAPSPEARRLAAATTDFDRRYLRLLDWASRHLPERTPGVAVVPERAVTGPRAYVAIYLLAPTPAILTTDGVPAGWFLLIQGERRPAGWRVVAEGPEGALLAPPS